MRNKIRFHLLALLRDLKMWRTSCVRCGGLGAYPCSICACLPMCTGCQTEESILLDKRMHE